MGAPSNILLDSPGCELHVAASRSVAMLDSSIASSRSLHHSFSRRLGPTQAI
jgi:hypothetical protein